METYLKTWIPHRNILSVVLMVCSWASLYPVSALQLTIGRKPFIENSMQIQAEIYPIAMNYTPLERISYWYGVGMSARISETSRLAGISYGLAFLGLNSGGVFVGPVFDFFNRNGGVAVDITYVFAALPVRVSLVRLVDPEDDLKMGVTLAIGFGTMVPILRRENRTLKHIFSII